MFLINACSSSPPQTQPAPSGPSPLQTLATRVTALETDTAILREIREELNNMKDEVTELKRLKRDFQDLEQLKRNQNQLLLEYQETFEDRIAEIERNLERNNLRFRQLAGNPQRLRNVRDASNQSEDTTARELSNNAADSSAVEETAPSSTSTALQESAPPSPVGAEDLFESGLTLITAKQYLKAIQTFQQLRKEYPDHPNAVEGYYLIGDAYYSLQDYQNAAITFYEFTEQYPQYPNYFEAQWKLAMSLEKSGEIGLSLDIYHFLMTEENSPYQEQAREKIEEYED